MKTLRKIVYWTLGITFGLPLAIMILVTIFQNTGPASAKAKERQGQREKERSEKYERAAESAARRAKERAEESKRIEAAAFEEEIKNDSLTLQNTWRQNPDIPKEIRELVRSKQIQIGLPARFVRLSWGDPKRINTTTTARGKSEQWIYGSSYVYLDDGIVTAIQQSKGDY